MSDRPSACPSWKRRDACEAWGAQGPRTCLRRAALHFDIFLGTESPAALTAHRAPGLRSSSYTVLWPSQGENVASYLQIEKLEDFKAAPAKSLAEHWAQCGWTVPTNSWASLQAFPSLSSRVQAWGPLLWEVHDYYLFWPHWVLAVACRDLSLVAAWGLLVAEHGGLECKGFGSCAVGTL